MKQSTISLFLFFLILSSSPAQRGWRSFDQFGWIIQIHQSTDHSLWFVGIDGIWHLNAGGWQQVPHASAFVFEDNAGALWVAGPNSQGLWHFDADEGWQQETQVTGIVSSIYQQADGTLWVGGDAVWRYDQSGWQQQQGATGGSGVIQIKMAFSGWVMPLGFDAMTRAVGNRLPRSLVGSWPFMRIQIVSCGWAAII